MGLFKNVFKMGRVYAGPEPRKEFEMSDVYAGPEQMGVPESMRTVPEDEINNKAEVNECEDKEQINHKRVPPPREIPEAPIQAIYAAPEINPNILVTDKQENGLFEQPPYPFNNMPQTQPMMGFIRSGETVGKGLASPGMPGYIENEPEADMIVCPHCGEKTPGSKFCVNCGQKF